MILDDNYPIIKGNDNNSNNSNSSNSNNDNRQSLMIKTTRNKDSLLALSKQTAAPSRNKYLNLNINDNNNNNNNSMKLKCNDNDYPIASLQSPTISNNKLNNCIKNDEPSIPLPIQNIIFQPSGSWIERKFLNDNINKNSNHQVTDQSSSLYYNNNKYHTLTSYVPSGLSIICHSTIKCIDIHCVGVSLLKIIFYKDSNDNNNSSSSSSSPGNNDKITTSNDNNKGNTKKNVITVNEISLPSIDMDDGDCYLPQRVSLTLPYPCIKVDVLLIKRKLDFVSIMGIAAYANTVRSASLSTPHK